MAAYCFNCDDPIGNSQDLYCEHCQDLLDRDGI